VVIDRDARPIEHYSMVGNVRVVVGPPRSVLVQHRVAYHPVRVTARTVGRWSGGEAHQMTIRAQSNHASFEAANQRRIDGNAHFQTVQAHVVETHPQIKAQVNARVQVGGHVDAGHGPVEHGPPATHAIEHGPGPAMGHGPVVHTPPPAEQGHGPVVHTPPPAEQGHGPVVHTTPPAEHVEGHGPVVHTPPAPPAHTTPPPAPPTHTTPTPPAHTTPPPAHTTTTPSHTPPKEEHH
jgi:hypothetical protein